MSPICQMNLEIYLQRGDVTVLGTARLELPFPLLVDQFLGADHLLLVESVSLVGGGEHHAVYHVMLRTLGVSTDQVQLATSGFITTWIFEELLCDDPAAGDIPAPEAVVSGQPAP